MRQSLGLCARVSGVAWNPPKSTPVLRSQNQRLGRINMIAKETGDDRNGRVHLNSILAQSGFLNGDAKPEKPLVNLPGVVFKSDLPADPITRLFFQQKGEYALYQGSYVNPEAKDTDRIEIERRESKTPVQIAYKLLTPMYDFCHRIREGSEQRKRFVIVPSTPETRGCAQVMMDHGILAGFRDFNNDRAFAVELKYFQNDPTITYIAPSSVDGKQEFEWSPKMMRRMLNNHGIHNRLVIFICRAADGRVIDHITATREQIGLEKRPLSDCILIPNERMPGDVGHHYKPPTPSFLMKHAVFPFYDYIVRFYPLWWTPNGITLFGIFCTTLASMLLFTAMPVDTNFTPVPRGTSRVAHVLAPFMPSAANTSAAGDTRRGTVPAYPLAASSLRVPAALPAWWTAEVTLVVAGVLNLIYCIADNTDGRQARRTKRSTFIGEYLDHGLDCVTSLMSTFLLATALGASVPLACVGVLVVAVATVLCHTVNHEVGIMVWGNDYLSVDEAMLAFGVGLWVPVLCPWVPTYRVPDALTFGLFPDGLLAVNVAYILFVLAQVHVMRTLVSLKRSILSRLPTLFIVLNALFFFYMMPHPSYRSGQLSSPKTTTLGGCCYCLASLIESLLSYPALWAITAACTCSMICHIPIVAKCASVQVGEPGPLGLVVLVWLVYSANPVWGMIAAVVFHVAQILYNVRYVEANKQRAAALRHN